MQLFITIFAALSLYYKPSCPYCKKVVHYLKSSGHEIEYIDTETSAQAKKDLTKKGGKSQVPCLFIDGKPMYESDAIIHYLKTHHPKKQS